jgi:hypothetical protein
MEYLITAKFRPDTYFLLGKEIVLDKEGQPIKIEDEDGGLRNKTKADEAKAQARALFSENGEVTIKLDDGSIFNLTLNFFASSAYRTGEWVSHITLGEDANVQYLWEAMSSLNLIYDLSIESYNQDLDSAPARLEGMVRTASWD